MRKSLSTAFILIIVSMSLVSVLPVYSVAAESTPALNKKELKALVVTAKTPAEHRTIAAYYRQRAQALSNKSAEHSAMAEQFAKGPSTVESKHGISFGLGASHCRHFVKEYDEQAKEAATLAAYHEEMATKAEQR
jgi:hypothetical protein